jgi:SAM-dependent methyltransferase
MQIRPFLESLPSLYEHWGTTAMQPKKAEPFREILEKVEQPTTANFLQLLTSAAEYLEPGEVICEIGCLNGANLIGVLADHPDRLAYGVDFFSTQAEVAENKIELLQGNLEHFSVAEQVCFSHQTIDDFFADLRDIETEDKFGLYVYNFEPDYRQVLMSLLLAPDFLADQALIIINNTNQKTVRQAVGDFLNTQSNAKIIVDWQSNSNQVFGSQGLGVIVWDSQNSLVEIQPIVIQESSFNPINLVNIFEQGDKKKVLHVGCGPYHPHALPPELRTEEWQEIRLDINPAVNPDILGTITDLSAVPDESVDAVFSSHNIEYIYTYEVPRALQEFKRVLKPHGMAVITCPDIQAVALEVAQGNLENPLYISPAGPIAAIDILYGLGTSIEQGNYYMAHKTAFTAETLKEKLLKAGFEQVKVRREGLNLWATAYVDETQSSQNVIHNVNDDSIHLYLDLMKKSLMNLIYDNDSDMMRGGQYEKELKLYGGIWPSIAHTMIGLPRLNNIQFCIEDILAKNIPGDLIETGVWRGGATIFMRAALKAYRITDRTVWVADSFEGLPPTEYEKDLNLRLDKVDCLAVSLEDVQSNFSKYGLLDEQVRFLKGWFKDTLPIAPIEQLAILRLDGDWYESTMDALTYLYPKLAIGGYVIIDDYWAVQGCRDAIQDYRLANQIQESIIHIDGAAVYWCRLN